MLMKRHLSQLVSIIKDKTVLITGGSKGIGYSIAEKLSSKGYNIILLARDELKMAEKVKELPTFDNRLQHGYIKFDLSQLASYKTELTRLIDENFDKKRGKSIDVLINCAGMTQKSMLPMTSIDAIQEIVNVNLISAMVLSKLVSRKLLNFKKKGQIINISSVLALDDYNGVKGVSIYSATKLAMIGFTMKLSSELQNRHIYSNVILPSLIKDTEIGESVNLEEFGKVGIRHITKEDVSDAVLQILDNDMNGQVITI